MIDVDTYSYLSYLLKKKIEKGGFYHDRERI